MRLQALWRIVLATLAISSVAPACSIFSSPIHVGTSFKVKVSGADGPVQGLTLRLKDLEGLTRSAVTDQAGLAAFDNVPIGTQYLQAEPDNSLGTELDVKTQGPANAIVPQQWPSIDPIHVRSLSGTMESPDAIPGHLDRATLPLELLDGISGRVLSSQSTTAHGEFDFGKLPPGIYFIRLKLFFAFRQEVTGLISVALDPNAPARADKLDLNLSYTSCGLMYKDALQCPQFDLRMKTLKGRVSDGGRRAVPYARIALLDAAKREVASVSADLHGDFFYSRPLEGAFELRMGGPGFTPMHALIHLEPAARDVALEIQVGNLGCSTIRYSVAR